jgi:hypothetical protein
MAAESDEQREVRQEFTELVNMAPEELEEWLATDESRSVGQDEDGESTGHKSGRRIVQLLREDVGEYTEDDYAHLRRVRGYIKRHLAQRPSKDLETSPWRYSLMNWGHDPLK